MTQQIQDLLAFLEPLGSVAEEADDPLDRFFHAVKFSEARIAPDRPVHEDAHKPLIMSCVDDPRLAYRRQQQTRGAGIQKGHVRTSAWILPKGGSCQTARIVNSGIFRNKLKLPKKHL